MSQDNASASGAEGSENKESGTPLATGQSTSAEKNEASRPAAQSATRSALSQPASAEQPVSQQPSAVAPAAVRPDPVQSGMPQSAATGPAPVQSGTAQSAPTQPATMQPVTAQSAAAEPATVQPGAAQSTVVEPAPVPSVTAQSAATGPAPLQSATAQSAASEPVAVQPATVQSGGVQAGVGTGSGASQKADGKVGRHITIFGQTIIPIVTAVIGVGMYAYSQWYVAEVMVKAPKDYNALEVHVINDRGNEQVFHTDHFQIAPDHYRFDITVDEQRHVRQEKDVKFGEKVVLTCQLPPGATVLKDYMAAEEVAPSSTQAVKTAGSAPEATFVPARRIASVPRASAVVPPATPGKPSKAADPAAKREAEALALAQLCYAERRLRNLPIAADDARLRPFLDQLGEIQKALDAQNIKGASTLIAHFVTRTDALVSQMATSGSAPGVEAGAIKGLPPFVAIDDVIFKRLNEILGVDAPGRIGPLLTQRVRIVFRLRELDNKGEDVSGQRNSYAHLESYLANHKGSISSEDYNRIRAEIKEIATQLKIADMPPFPPGLPAIPQGSGVSKSAGSGGQASAGSSGVAPAALSSSSSRSALPGKQSSSQASAVPSRTAPTQEQGKPAVVASKPIKASAAPSNEDIEAINLARLCASSRQLRNQPVSPDDPRVKPLLDQLAVIQSTLSSNKKKAYPLINAFGKSVVALQGQLGSGDGGSGNTQDGGQKTASLRNVQQLNDVEDMAFNRLQEILGPDTPARVGPFLMQRVEIPLRLRAMESQGQDVSAARAQYAEMNGFLLKQKRFSPAIAKQIEPQVKDLCSQLGIK